MAMTGESLVALVTCHKSQLLPQAVAQMKLCNSRGYATATAVRPQTMCTAKPWLDLLCTAHGLPTAAAAVGAGLWGAEP